MSDDVNRDVLLPDGDPVASRLPLTLDFDSGADRGASTAYAAEPSVTEGFDAFYFLRLLHKWRWMAATTFLLVVGGTALYTFTIVPVYEARVRVLVQPERINILKIEDIIEQDRSVEAQIAVLQSRWLAKETM